MILSLASAYASRSIAKRAYALVSSVIRLLAAPTSPAAVLALVARTVAGHDAAALRA